MKQTKTSGRLRRPLFALALSLALCLGALAPPCSLAHAADHTAASWDQLTSAVHPAAGGSAAITVDGQIALPQTLVIPAGTSISLLGAP